MSPSRSYSFPRAHRLSGKPRFDAVFVGKTREIRGPLMLYAIPNSLSHLRLGISISRKVGIAAVRNRIKRLLRESYRLLQHDLPVGYDIVIVVRPHVPLDLGEYQKLILSLTAKVHGVWTKRGNIPPLVPGPS